MLVPFRSSLVYTRTFSDSLGVRIGFLTSEVFEKIWRKLSKERVEGEAQSIILTILAKDRVGSIVYSVPRQKAIMCGKEYNLPKLTLPTSA
ncbi:hypothetical protein K505DRAFT_329515 [Melanomma pulvis-pyrius CBS 109.77]|uniref:Uncharacterized protein n=1 Tax=Melanomma pulvis-pyrius CBS 109.77 TaxID=1314802 RepID=A0A6A6WU35_9PLEO|nr:hypothetical protein K505DRAFT_329515 [Melanomma pulvis-pyrius CBS 109.77]